MCHLGVTTPNLLCVHVDITTATTTMLVPAYTLFILLLADASVTTEKTLMTDTNALIEQWDTLKNESVRRNKTDHNAVWVLAIQMHKALRTLTDRCMMLEEQCGLADERVRTLTAERDKWHRVATSRQTHLRQLQNELHEPTRKIGE